MAAAARQGPYRPLALAAASPWTNSTSPTGRISTGPAGRYMALVSIHGGTHVVTAVNVGDQFVEQIPLVGDALGSKVPEVMMGVADRNLRLQCWFLGQGQPVISSVRHNGSSVCVTIDDAPF